jgi:hypothetical protein
MVSFSSLFEYCEPLQRVAASAYATNISAPHCCISLSTDMGQNMLGFASLQRGGDVETQKLGQKWTSGGNNRVKK